MASKLTLTSRMAWADASDEDDDTSTTAFSRSAPHSEMDNSSDDETTGSHCELHPTAMRQGDWMRENAHQTSGAVWSAWYSRNMMCGVAMPTQPAWHSHYRGICCTDSTQSCWTQNYPVSAPGNEVGRQYLDPTIEERCSQWLLDLEAGGIARDRALSGIATHMLELSYDKQGTRVVQKALQVAPAAIAAVLLGELRGHVWNLIQSSHGNFVISAVVEYCTVDLGQFIVEELAGWTANVACDRNGCRVLNSIFSHWETDTAKAIAQEIIELAFEVAMTEHGTTVVQTLLEHGSEEQKRRIVDNLTKSRRIWKVVFNKYGSFALQKALDHCGIAEQRKMCGLILRGDKGESSVLNLASNTSGVYVLGSLLKLHRDLGEDVRTLQMMARHVHQSKTSKKMLEADMVVRHIVSYYTSM